MDLRDPKAFYYGMPIMTRMWFTVVVATTLVSALKILPLGMLNLDWHAFLFRFHVSLRLLVGTRPPCWRGFWQAWGRCSGPRLDSTCHSRWNITHVLLFHQPLLQIWRIFTNVFYVGKLGLQFLFNVVWL